jgi:hypothetical protein
VDTFFPALSGPDQIALETQVRASARRRRIVRLRCTLCVLILACLAAQLLAPLPEVDRGHFDLPSHVNVQRVWLRREARLSGDKVGDVQIGLAATVLGVDPQDLESLSLQGIQRLLFSPNQQVQELAAVLSDLSRNEADSAVARETATKVVGNMLDVFSERAGVSRATLFPLLPRALQTPASTAAPAASAAPGPVHSHERPGAIVDSRRPRPVVAAESAVSAEVQASPEPVLTS